MPSAIEDEKHITLRYSKQANPIANGSTEELKLLEMCPEILKWIEAGAKDNEPLSLTIKGRPGDDAVICTPTSTFQLRTISLSNSVLVFSAPPTKEYTLELNDTCREIFEVIPTVPKLERIGKVLQESRWKGLDGGESLKRKEREDDPWGMKPSKRERRYTKAQLESFVQASDGELSTGLEANNVIEVDGHLLHLPSSLLYPLLSILLSHLTIHSLPSTTTTSKSKILAPTAPILSALLTEHDLSHEFSKSLLGLFGTLILMPVELGANSFEMDRTNEAASTIGSDESVQEVWECDVEAVGREVGKGLLAVIKPNNLPTKEKFMQLWREQVGVDHVLDMSSLNGEFLYQPGPLGSTLVHILPFPLSSLPIDATHRFTQLFQTRSRWRPEEMKPFLKGLVREEDTTGMEKLVVKFARVVKEREGTWWYPKTMG